jgi:hypothetical protein
MLLIEYPTGGALNPIGDEAITAELFAPPIQVLNSLSKKDFAASSESGLFWREQPVNRQKARLDTKIERNKHTMIKPFRK